ncbi:unnamed protein product [Oikopleura dioica]|uniref:Uncharacterized protein n=1 Tax=Oikopleura dioica TaxID=34765 RepID=E4XQ54_OIKDI|nr:unnamed protein product [Oikopleura dioica]
MDAPMRVQTCLMNLKRSIFDEDEENLELAVLKMEKIPKEFLEVRELDILAGTILKMSIQRCFNWTMLNQFYLNLRKKWFRLIPANKLVKIINYVQRKPESIENFKNVLTENSYETVRILAQNLDSNTLRSLMLRIIKEDISNTVFDEKKLTITPIQNEKSKNRNSTKSKKAKRKLEWDLPGPTKRK